MHMTAPIAILSITSDPSKDKSVEYFRLQQSKAGDYMLKHQYSDGESLARTTQGNIPIPSDVVEEQVALLRSARIPAIPPPHEVRGGTFFNLSLYGSHIDLQISWLEELPAGYEALGNFVAWIRCMTALQSEMEESNSDH